MIGDRFDLYPSVLGVILYQSRRINLYCYATLEYFIADVVIFSIDYLVRVHTVVVVVIYDVTDHRRRLSILY